MLGFLVVFNDFLCVHKVKKNPFTESSHDDHVRISRDDIMQMIKMYDLNPEKLRFELENNKKYNEADKNEILKLIEPLLYLTKKDDEDDGTHLKSLKKESEDKVNAILSDMFLDDGEQMPIAKNDYESEREKNLAKLLGGHQILDDLGLDNKHVSALKADERRIFEERINKVVSLILQCKQGIINQDQFVKQVDTVMPIKHFPAVVTFIKQNGIDLQQKPTQKTAETSMRSEKSELINRDKAIEIPTKIVGMPELMEKLLNSPMQSTSLHGSHVESIQNQKGGLQR